MVIILHYAKMLQQVGSERREGLEVSDALHDWDGLQRSAEVRSLQ